MPTLEDDRLVFRFPQSDPAAEFRITFRRTLRIPDTDRTYPLPPGLGRFPLLHAEDFARLPQHMAARGGVVMPMWQAEALWIDFSHASRRDLPVAVKVAAGKINAVTGEAWSPALNRDPQDYMVAPTQQWLDGFASAPGEIRQFVAMPMGEGYSAEEQVTGQSDWGGLQISVTPMKRDAWERYREAEEGRYQALCEETAIVMSCRMDMGLGAGGRMHQAVEEDPHDFADWDLRATDRVFVSILHAEHWLALTGQAPPTEPPSAHAYARAGLPWFSLSGSSRTPLPGAGALRRLRSVADLHAAKTGQALPGSQDVQTGAPIRLDDAAPRKAHGANGQ